MIRTCARSRPRSAKRGSRRASLILAPLVLFAMSLGIAATGGPISCPGMPVLDAGCLTDYDKYLDRYVDGGYGTLEGRVEVPVLVVHGWTGSAEQLDDNVSINAWNVETPVAEQATGSILKRLAEIPRASVFTFNYEEFSARWAGSSFGRHSKRRRNAKTKLDRS